MPVTVDATVGGAAANSYLTRARASTLLEARLDTAPWDTAVEDSQNRALVQATRLIDLRVVWLGTRASETQALAWPRSGVVYRDSLLAIPTTIIPLFLELATAEYALSLLRTVSTSVQAQSELKRLVDGSLTLEFRDTLPVVTTEVIPDAVALYLEGYGETAAGSNMVWLRRA